MGIFKKMRDAELQNVPPQYLGGGIYTDPLTKMTVETPTFGDGTNAVGGVAWLLVAPFALLARLVSGPRHVTAAPVAVPYTPGVPTPMTGAVMGNSYGHSYESENPEPFVIINGESVPREFADMYEHGLDEVCFHGESNGTTKPH